MQDLISLLRQHAEACANVRLKVRSGSSERRVGDAIPATGTPEEIADAVAAAMELVGEARFKVVLEDGAGKYLASCTVAFPDDLQDEAQPGAPSNALQSIMGSTPEGIALDSVVQALRDDREAINAREKRLDERYDRLIDSLLRSNEQSGAQVSDLTSALIGMAGAFADDKIQSAEARAAAAEAAPSSGDAIERVVEKGIDAWLTGSAIDKGISPEVATMISKPGFAQLLAKVAGNPRLRKVLDREDAPTLFEQALEGFAEENP